MNVIIRNFKYKIGKCFLSFIDGLGLLLSTKVSFKEVVYLSTRFFKCRLGGTPLMELMIAAGKAVPQLMVEHGLAVDRVYTGSFMTSLDMEGLLLYIMSRQSTLFCFPFSSMIWMHLSNQGP
jgi:hypothetical protein